MYSELTTHQIAEVEQDLAPNTDSRRSAAVITPASHFADPIPVTRV